MSNKIILIVCFVLAWRMALPQSVPGEEEKIPYLTTFSKQAKTSFGDDDFTQIWFFVVPENSAQQVFIRVYDPDCGGKADEVNNGFNSKTSFAIYGGIGAHSNKEAKTNAPKGNYKSGVQLATKTFADEKEWDEKWYTFGPFNPLEGELQKENGGYVFKVIIEGLDGDDGNLYRMFLSREKDKNTAVEGGNSFSYEYSFRLSDEKGAISHIYPFVAANVKAVNVNVFDFDDDGIIRTVTVAKKGVINKSPEDGKWYNFKIEIVKEELVTSMDIQMIKKKEFKNNNVVVYITNQYNELLPFYTVPIGGVPKYNKFKIGTTPIK